MINSTTPTLDAERQLPHSGRLLGAAFALLMLIYSAGFVIGGELGQVALAGLESLPFTVLAVLAYVGITQTWGKVLAIGWLLVVLGLIFLNGFLSGVLGLMEGALTALVPGTLPRFQPGAAVKLAAIFGLSLLALLVSLLGFIPGVRHRLSQYLPIDPHSFVHTIALVAVIATTLLSFIPLIVLNAPPTLLAVGKLTDQGTDLAGDRGTSGQLLSRVYSLSWTIPGAIFAVGYAVRRNLRQALARLGFVRPTAKQVLIGVVSAALLVVVATTLGYAVELLWQALGWPTTDAEAFTELIQFAFSPVGAVVIGVTAGVGEELGVRGVLQPRLGILLSNLFFISLHAFQYHWNTLLVIFVVGLAFGILRKRTNTTTSAIAHGTYDFILVMLTVLEVPLFSE